MTNRRTFLTAVGASVLSVLAGCSDNKSQEEIMAELDNVDVLKPGGEGMGNSAKMLRFVDKDAETLVYVQLGAMGIKAGGIATLPITETEMEL